MKRLTLSFVLVAVSLLSPVILVYAAPVTLGVSLHGQNTPSWCWAASAQMVVEFHDALIDQCELVHYVSPWKDCCGTTLCNTDATSADAVFGSSSVLYT